MSNHLYIMTYRNGTFYTFEVKAPMHFEGIDIGNMFNEAFDNGTTEVRELLNPTTYKTFHVLYEGNRNRMIGDFAEECKNNGSSTINGYTVTLISSEPIYLKLPARL